MRHLIAVGSILVLASAAFGLTHRDVVRKLYATDPFGFARDYAVTVHTSDLLTPQEKYIALLDYIAYQGNPIELWEAEDLPDERRNRMRQMLLEAARARIAVARQRINDENSAITEIEDSITSPTSPPVETPEP